MAQTLGPYTLGQPLGTLAFGELVEAAHAARREPLALLILADELARDQRLRGLLRLEIARAGGLRHPSVARPIEVGDHDGRLYVVYERPPGDPLSLWIEDGTGLSAETTMTVVRRLADGLDAAHGRRLAHGSIRTGAIVTRAGESATLLGIGVLAAIDEAGLSDACRQKQNPVYAAPEQERGRLGVPTADAYALGRLAQVMLERIGGDRSGEIAPSVQAVLDRQAGAEPSARYRTCTDFAAALSAVLSESAPVPDAATPPGPADDDPPSTAVRATAPPFVTPAADTQADTPPDPSTAPDPPPVRARRASSKKRPPPEPATPELQPIRLTSLPTTPAMRAWLDAALASAVTRAILLSVLPMVLLIVVLSQQLPEQGIMFAIGAVIAAFWLGLPSAVRNVVQLRRARRDPSIVQAYGTVRVIEQTKKSRQSTITTYEIEIGPYDTFEIDKATFAAIALASPAADPDSQVELGWGPSTRTDAFWLQRAYVTYSRTAQRILEVAGPDGELIHTDPAYAGEDADEETRAGR